MAAGAGTPDGGPEGPNRSGGGSAFACNLCLEPAREAVIGRCGHLYCTVGPAVAADTAPLRRLWGWDQPRHRRAPLRAGQRPPGPPVPPTSPGSSFHVAFGFGAFPFAFFSAAPQPPPAGTGDAGDPPPGSLDSIFLFIAAAFFLWLLSV
ncbi:E3 ubiquitin-protein ligase RNF5-like isoform X2 [Phalacrocorax carbo]|uniref:E3 ubiquitin-protein ligase RNF5-like isoform X2 n=1 Tax=Phalacrocorax carbo TaxID=9209 RepID=UPI00311A656F